MASRKPFNRTPTLRDVGAAAGVDASTASRVLNDDERLRVRPETRQRVLDVAVALRYRPNALAKGLKLARTGALGLVIPDITNPGYGALIRGAQEEAAAHDVLLLLGNTDESQSLEGAYERFLREGRVDGLILATALIDDEVVAEIAKRGSKVVLVNRKGDQLLPSVIADDQKAGALPTEHLIELGHERVVHVAGSRRVDTAVRRRKGYEQTMRQAGLRQWVVDGGWTEEAGFKAGERLFADGPAAPTGVVAANTRVALGVVAAARKARLSIPDDVSVAGIDDLPGAEFAVPPLTTVWLPLFDMGRMAVRILLGYEKAGPRESRVVRTDPRLIIRESTAKLPDE
jgi:LacI family transcriptional regulator